MGRRESRRTRLRVRRADGPLGRELLREAGYFHSVSMLDDPLRINGPVRRHGIKVSGLSTHTPITKPEIGTEYLKQAIRFAAECGAPVSTPMKAETAVDDRGGRLHVDAVTR